MTVEELNKILSTAYESKFVLAGDASHWTCTDYEIIKFAAKIATAEREACAKFLIDLYKSDGYYHPAEEFAKNAAAAIRARGK